MKHTAEMMKVFEQRNANALLRCPWVRVDRHVYYYSLLQARLHVRWTFKLSNQVSGLSVFLEQRMRIVSSSQAYVYFCVRPRSVQIYHRHIIQGAMSSDVLQGFSLQDNELPRLSYSAPSLPLIPVWRSFARVHIGPKHATDLKLHGVHCTASRRGQWISFSVPSPSNVWRQQMMMTTATTMMI